MLPPKENNLKETQHREVVEHRRKSGKNDDEFRQKAAENNERLMRTHEFRKDNIKQMELGDKDYFEYTSDEPERYSALDFDYMFKFETTFSAIKWGVFVGSLFAFHRYYRTRDVNNAAHWFTVMSFFSFFNIWVSNSIQHFISDYTMRKSISLSQRNEYQTNAFELYYDHVQNNVDNIDKELTVQPVMKNSQAESLDEFVENYQKYLCAKHATSTSIRIFGNKMLCNKEGQEIINKDVYNKPLSRDQAKQKVLNAIKMVEEVDLKSFDFDRDPDNVYL